MTNFFSKTLLIVSALALSLGSCNSLNDEPQREVFSAFATLYSMADGAFTFTIQANGSSDAVMLTSNFVAMSTLTVGSRYVIAYSTPTNEPYKSGSMTLYEIYDVVQNDAVEASEDEISGVTIDPVSVTYLSITGEWLNATAIAPLIVEPRLFNAYVDESTLDSPYPDVYIGFRSDDTGAFYQRTFFGSFNITSLREMSDIEGITVHYKYNGEALTRQLDF